MKNSNKKLHLQLFAEGADNGEGATPATEVDETPAEDNAANAEQQPADNGQHAIDENEDAILDAEFKALIHGKYKGAFERNFKENMDRRMKTANQTIADLTKQVEAAQPTLDFLKKRHGTEDVAELEKAVSEDPLYVRDIAMRTGKSEEEVLADMRAEKQREAEKLKRNQDNAELEAFRAEQMNRQKIAEWVKNASEVQSIYPDFDLKTEIKDKTFVKMLEQGYPMQMAYESVHHNEILERVKRETAESVRRQTLDSVASGAGRPAENGITSQAAVHGVTDVNNLTEKDIFNILKEVESGKKISF